MKGDHAEDVPANELDTPLVRTSYGAHGDVGKLSGDFDRCRTVSEEKVEEFDECKQCPHFTLHEVLAPHFVFKNAEFVWFFSHCSSLAICTPLGAISFFSQNQSVAIIAHKSISSMFLSKRKWPVDSARTSGQAFRLYYFCRSSSP